MDEMNYVTNLFPNTISPPLLFSLALFRGTHSFIPIKYITSSLIRLFRIGSVFYFFNFKGTLRVEETNETIDYEQLKVKEKILFFDELVLFEVGAWGCFQSGHHYKGLFPFPPASPQVIRFFGLSHL